MKLNIGKGIKDALGGIGDVIDKVFDGAGGLVKDVGESGVLDSEAAKEGVKMLGAAHGVPTAGGQSGGEPPKDNKFFDYTNEHESDWKWPAIIGGVLIVVGFIAYMIWGNKGGKK